MKKRKVYKRKILDKVKAHRKNYTVKKHKIKQKIDRKLLLQLIKINYNLNKNNVLDLIELTGNTKKYLARSFSSGIVKGAGIGIGFSIITAVIIYFLQKLIKLNIPGISKYIADIVEIVQRSK